MAHLFTSESVSEGHPDKIADQISDAILDELLRQDPHSRVAVETLVTTGLVVLSGEVTTRAYVDVQQIARDVIRRIGYVDPALRFDADSCGILSSIHEQSPDISRGVYATDEKEQGAGDQGIMFGYATNETPEYMPLPILLAHRLARTLARYRKQENGVSWLRPDSKTQVSVVYENGRPVRVTDVLVSTMHAPDVTQDEIRSFVATTLVPEALGDWWHDELRLIVNPSGSFVQGGPSADAGVTGRKIIVDTYGGMGRHGGGAFSGKDPSKVDRSGAYFCRYVARELVAAGLAERAEIQVAYAIGVAQPVSVKVDTFGTGDERAAEDFVRRYDFRPRAIIERLGLLRPIYRQTTNYGHFGKPELPWEGAQVEARAAVATA